MLKGQMTIVTLIFTVIILAIFGAMLPAINTIITNTLPHTDTATGTLLQLFPFIMLALIIGGIWFFGRPAQEV